MNKDKIGHPLHITVPITKVDEEKRMVYGYATVEEIDKHGEIIGYEASKKAFGEWPGNIREMHDPVAVGVNKEVTYDDVAKGVWIGAYVSESADGQNAWTKVKEGVLQGFSIGGTINDYEVIKGDDGEGHLFVTDYDLNEVSLVDNPACPTAIFQMVKSTDKGLRRVEKMGTGPGRPVPWFEKAFHFAPDQKVITHSLFKYNEDSMGKQKTDLVKSLWEAETLVDLAECLENYIYWKAWEGQDMAELKTALESIKTAAAAELSEPSEFPEVSTAIELAAKALNITKKEELAKMSTDRKQLGKSTVGQPDRDDTAEVVVSAEDNGRPLNDTPERAAENGVAAAGAVVTDKDGEPVLDDDGNEVTAGLAYAPGAPAGDAAGNVPDEEAQKKGAAGKVESTTDEPPKTETPKTAPTDDEGVDDGKDAKGKKSADAADLKKSTENNELAAQILKGVGALIDEKVKPIQEELDALKGKPAVSKAKASFTDVEKVDKVEDKVTEQKDEMDALLKRADELAESPTVGTPQERIQLAHKIRKMQTLMDPTRMQQHDEIRAQFNKTA